MKDCIISFETAKLLKEKDWKIPTLNLYFEDGELKENVLSQTTGMDYGSEFEIEFSEFLENWNDKWLTKKNGDRCFGCSKSKGYLETFSAPTQSLLQRWLREVHNIHILVSITISDKWYFELYKLGSKRNSQIVTECCYYNSYEEALGKGLYEGLKII